MFDARAEHYDDGTMHRWLAEQTVSLVSVGQHALVVDVAAGTGLAGRALRHRQPSARVIAVDLAAELLRVARSYGLLAVQAEAERLPIESHTVDAVYCVSAAAYFPNPQQALNECSRVLRSGGTCLVQTWREDTVTPTRVLRQAAATVGLAIPDPNSALGTGDRLRDAMSTAALTNIRIDHRVWHAAWPEPETAWRGAMQGPFGGSLQRLDSPSLGRVREAFLSQLQRLVSQQVDDRHGVLFGLGMAP